MNQRKETYVPRRSNGPRRGRLGIKPVHEIAALRQDAIARRWIDALEAPIPVTMRGEGEILAREGMVMSIEFRAGLIEGTVQPALPLGQLYAPTGSSPRTFPGTGAAPGALYGKHAQDCKIAIRVQRYTEEAWNDTVLSLSTDSSAVASLLAGELPADIDELLARHGAPLIPPAHEKITLDCSCDADEPCAHRAAIVYLAVDRLHDDPSLGLILRGLSPAELTERMRQVRTAAARRSASLPGIAQLTDEREISPLAELTLEEFWRAGPEFEDFAHLPPSSHAPHALLRRLGPSPLGGSFPLVGLLASAYDTIKAHAEKLRDDAEEKED
jgi:uncharacterized Zn finger protein